MDAQDSLKLVYKGREEWNAWAERMLVERSRLEKSGLWIEEVGSDARFEGKNSETKEWLEAARVSFTAQHIGGDNNFRGFIFPGDAWFDRIVFQQTVSFEQSVFKRDAYFNGTHLNSGQTSFDNAAFSGIVEFTDAVLYGASFTNTSFARRVMFRNTIFGSANRTDFKETYFNYQPDFTDALFGNVEFFKTKFTLGAIFKRTRFANTCVFKSPDFGTRVTFEGAIFTGYANFAGVTIPEGNFSHTQFKEYARFDDCHFYQDVDFSNSTFTKTASLKNAIFYANAKFLAVTFTQIACFSDAIFEGDALFKGASFNGETRFDAVQFTGISNFDQVVFNAFTYFEKVFFNKESSFIAMKGESFLSMANATFVTVPNFAQAHFEEAPRLDQSSFGTEARRAVSNDVAARWRALKRLAIQAHDHEREQKFFAEEIKSLRGVEDRLFPNIWELTKGRPAWPGGGRYWAGLFYQFFSDFGRSMLLPLVGWVLLMIFSALFYLDQHLAIVEPASTAEQWIVGVGTAPAMASLSCLSGNGNSVAAAAYLSIHNGLVFSGLGRSSKLDQSYACLYGGDSSTPNMPDDVVFVGILQTVFSAIFIFLLLLAVRNQFRIK